MSVVAAPLAERALLVMQRNEPYVIRDVDGQWTSPRIVEGWVYAASAAWVWSFS